MKPVSQSDSNFHLANAEANIEQNWILSDTVLIRGLLASIWILLTILLSGVYVVRFQGASDPMTVVLWVIFCIVAGTGFIQLLADVLKVTTNRYREILSNAVLIKGLAACVLILLAILLSSIYIFSDKAFSYRSTIVLLTDFGIAVGIGFIQFLIGVVTETASRHRETINIFAEIADFVANCLWWF